MNPTRRDFVAGAAALLAGGSTLLTSCAGPSRPPRPKNAVPVVDAHVHCFAGFEDKPGRKELLEKHGIEIGGGLGDLAGKVWRIGLMGYGARAEVVDQLLAALKSVLKK